LCCAHWLSSLARALWFAVLLAAGNQAAMMQIARVPAKSAP
jgi:hypothetical protein